MFSLKPELPTEDRESQSTLPGKQSPINLADDTIVFTVNHFASLSLSVSSALLCAA
jgi:hypothetical protein